MNQADDIMLHALSRPHELTFLFGAGVSVPEPVAIPTVYMLYERLMDLAEMSFGLREAIWDKIKSMHPQPRFEVFVHHLQQDIDTELRFTEVFNVDAFNCIHAFIADLIKAGACAITTNFDRCVELAGITTCTAIAYDGIDLSEALRGNLLFKPHGSIGNERRQLIITDKALSCTAGGFALLPNWRKTLLDAIDGRTLIIMGYSGSDDFDITPVLAQSTPRQVFWISHDPQNLRTSSLGLTGIIGDALRDKPLTVLQGSMQDFIEGYYETRSMQPIRRQELGNILCPIFEEPSRKRKLERLFLRHFCCFEELLQSAAPTPIFENGRDHAFALFKLSHYQQCVKYADQCINDSQLNMSDRWEIEYYRTSALIMMGHYSDALAIAHSMSRRFLEIEDIRFRCEWQNLCGTAWYLEALYNEALDMYGAAHSTAIENGYIEGAATATWGISSCYEKLGKPLMAIPGYKEAATMSEALGKLSNCVTLHRNIADAFLNIGEFKQARDHIKRAQKLIPSVNQKHNDIYVCLTLLKFAIIDNHEDEYSRLAIEVLAIFQNGVATALAVEVVAALALGHIDCGFSLEKINYSEFVEFLSRSIDIKYQISVLGSEELINLLYEPFRHREFSPALIQRFRAVVIKSST